MKKIIPFCAAAAVLCACAGQTKHFSAVKESIWNQDPMNMCASLIEQNKKALETIHKQYGQDAAQAAAPLYQELDLQSNAVCRSRIAQQAQVERLKELRAQYTQKIETAILQTMQK